MVNRIIKNDKKFYSKLFAIGLPIAFQNLITSALNMIDVFMISSLGVTAVAAVGGANKLYFLLNLFLFGTSSGTGIFSAQYWGKKDVKNIKRILGLCLIISVSGGALFSIAAIFFPKFVMHIFSTEEEVIIEGIKYLRIIGFSYCFTAISFAYIFVLRGMNQVKMPMIITIISICINTFLNWVLIYGNLGVEPLGVKGAAIATLIARTVECSLLITSVYVLKLPIAGKIKELFDISKSFVSKYLYTVLPVMCNEVMWSLGVATYSFVYGRMGEDVMATMTLNQTIEQLFMVMFFGISSACAVILGNEIGNNKTQRAFEYSKKFIKITVITAVCMSLLIIGASGFVVNLFDDLTDVVRYNSRLCLIVFGLFVPFKALNLILVIGVLRSGGDTRFTMILDMCGVWLIGVPLAFLSGLVLKWDIQFVYACILSEEFFKMTFALKRMYSKKWLNNLV
ncbi:MATE family efflux transporter [Vallitalea sp.]|jgi:putative MATE family efflux protein|uniref:MATE family efflux transporter n=1 Tax=Vallitalea sp. TaxID=1882829 RepID=UPI0025F149B8|nr:MATE family efflux transporter [Vallitalea sp.]MCT4687322.1 MATE family efflux transporter [Vallitalea sp.]